MGDSVKDRIKRLRDEMKVRGLGYALVFTADEHGSEYIDEHFAFRKYLSGFTGSAGSLLFTGNEAGLWTDGRYFLQAGRQLEGSGITLHKMGEPGVRDIFEYLEDLTEKATDKGAGIGLDLKLLSVESYNKLEKICSKYGCSVTDIDLADIVWTDRPKMTHEAIYHLDISLSGVSVSDKLAEIRKKLDKNRADCLIISELSDVMWTFNVRGGDILYNPVAVSYGYVDMKKACFYAYPESLSEGVREALEKEGVSVRDYDDFDGDMKDIKGRKVLYDPKTLNAHVYTLIKENTLTGKRSWEIIRKHIKNETECALARKWHIEDGLAVTRFIYRIKKLVKEGTVINEYEAAMMMDKLRYEIDGNRGLSFDTISAYGSNGAIIHYSPDDEGSAVLKDEGFLLLDSGGQYEGATTDITRTIALGNLSEEMKNDYTAVLKGVLDLAAAVFLEGARGENLDILARRPIWDRYLDYRHGTGHGVGAMLSVHEGPQAFRYKINDDNKQPKLEPGMITSDEPGIYLEGRYGIRIENLLLCVNRMNNEWGNFYGFETLTYVPYERDAIIPDLLTAGQKEILNAYNARVYDLYKDRLSEEESSWLRDITLPYE